MQQLATGLLTSGDNATDFTRYSELALVQQNYLQQMGALWVNSAFGSGPVQPAKGDRRFASEEWKKSPYHEFLKQSYLVNARYVNDLIERASLDDSGRDQPGSAPQAQLLGRRQAGKAARALAGDGARGARKLVVGLERLASFSRRHAGAGTHAPGQHRVSRDRACARPLRHDARRLNQIWRLEEENHD